MPQKKRITALTQGFNVPSARYRIRQLIPLLTDNNVIINELISSTGAYPPNDLKNRLIWFYNSIVENFERVNSANDSDCIIIQRELISTLPSFEFLLKKPVIADIDDAIWLHKGGIAAKNLAKNVNHIVVGNSYLANFFQNLNKNIEIIPTGVDTDKYINFSESVNNDGTKIIGWSGTSGGYKYFEKIQKKIGVLLRKYPDWKIRFVSDERPNFPHIPSSQIEYIKWSPDNDVNSICEMDIGLMPLNNDAWSLGKCSYKMLLYMSCKIPVVVSDIGMNSEILKMGEVGLGVNKFSDWTDELEFLMINDSVRRGMGDVGRGVVENNFCLSIVCESWMKLLKKYI